MLSRRKFLAATAVLGSVSACGHIPVQSGTAEERARRLIARRPSLDLHAHPGRTFIKGAQNLTPALEQFVASGPSDDQAIMDMRAGGMSSGVFSAVADFQLLDFTKQGLVAKRQFKPGEAQESYLVQLANLNALATSANVKQIRDPSDLLSAHRAGKTGIIFGVEGGDFLEGSSSRVSEAYEQGIRCITPVHYHTNEIGDIMTGSEVHGGLSAAGAACIRAMNAAGIIVDVAHASEKTAFDMVETSDRPVLCSHTHIRTPDFDAPRFISLDLAKAITSAGGVIGAWPAGIGISDLDGFVDRIFELIDFVGIDHVGIGTDMDANFMPVWSNYRQFPEVVAKLITRGLDPESISKIIGGNGLRVFQAVSS